ncbi:MAG TPA: hypothetical protein VFV41_04400 [Streptosporangiaceae bacterium]|nr:hypothetical protein [Streptosporangiaceae bacterium]
MLAGVGEDGQHLAQAPPAGKRVAVITELDDVEGIRAELLQRRDDRSG